MANPVPIRKPDPAVEAVAETIADRFTGGDPDLAFRLLGRWTCPDCGRTEDAVAYFGHDPDCGRLNPSDGPAD